MTGARGRTPEGVAVELLTCVHDGTYADWDMAVRILGEAMRDVREDALTEFSMARPSGQERLRGCDECGRARWEHHPLCSEPWVETPREAWLEDELAEARAALGRVRTLADKMLGANHLAYQSAIGQAIHDAMRKPRAN